MDLLQLQYFRTIAQYENMTKAAEALFVSQPNLSTSLSRLEADLGVRLFERRRGKISLTANGQLFLSYVERSLNELEIGVERLRSENSVTNNCIRVAGSLSDLISLVMLQCYPRGTDIRIKQVGCSNDDIYDRVISEAVDFGFYFGEPKSDALEYHLIVQSERVAIVPREHPLSGQRFISLSQLADENFICNHCRDDAEFLYDVAPRLGGFSPRISFDCDDPEMEATLVAAGKGVSISPSPSFRKLLRSNPKLPITFLRFSDSLPMAQLGLVRRRGHRLSQASLAFYQYLTQFLQEDTESTRRLLELPIEEWDLQQSGPLGGRS